MCHSWPQHCRCQMPRPGACDDLLMPPCCASRMVASCLSRRCNRWMDQGRNASLSCGAYSGGFAARVKRGSTVCIPNEPRRMERRGEDTYAMAMATAKTAVSSLHDVRSPCPMGDGGLSPEQLLVPPLAKTAMAMKPAMKQTSSTTARNAKKVLPPRKKVRRTAKAV